MQQLTLGKEVLSKVLARELSKVNISVTYACNYQCKTCNIWRTYVESPDLKAKELTLSDYNDLFKENQDLMWISFTGGEPFLRSDFAEIVVSAIKAVEKIRVVNIATNGSMPEHVEKGVRRILDEAKKGIHVFVEVSIDGVEPVHNDMRGVKDAYRKTLETFLKLRSLKEETRSELFDVKLEYTISKFNAGKLEDTIDALKNSKVPVGFSDFVITFAHNSFYYRNMANEVKPQMDSMLNEVSWFFKQYQNRNIFDRVTKSYLKTALRYFNEELKPPCAAGVYSCFLDPYGNVYPCITMNYILGNLKKDGFNLGKVLRNPQSVLFHETLKSSCPTCWTSCEAYQTIIFNFHHFLKDLL